MEWMHSLKNARYQAEQALIFSYIKDCLVRYWEKIADFCIWYIIKIIIINVSFHSK